MIVSLTWLMVRKIQNTIMDNPIITSGGGDLLQHAKQLNSRLKSKHQTFSDNFLSAAQIAHQVFDNLEADDRFEKELRAAEREAEDEMRKIVTEFSSDDD